MQFLLGPRQGSELNGQRPRGEHQRETAGHTLELPSDRVLSKEKVAVFRQPGDTGGSVVRYPANESRHELAGNDTSIGEGRRYKVLTKVWSGRS